MPTDLTVTQLPRTSTELRREMGRLAIPGLLPGTAPVPEPDPHAGCTAVVVAGALHTPHGLGVRPGMTLYCLHVDPVRPDTAHHGPALSFIAQRLGGLDLRVFWLSRAACSDLLNRFAEFRGLIFRATSAHIATLNGARSETLTSKGKGALQ